MRKHSTDPFVLAPVLCGFRHTLFDLTYSLHADVLSGLSLVPAPRTSAEPKDKFLSHCSQVSAGDHMQIIGDPIGAVEVKVLKSQTHT